MISCFKMSNVDFDKLAAGWLVHLSNSPAWRIALRMDSSRYQILFWITVLSIDNTPCCRISAPISSHSSLCEEDSLPSERSCPQKRANPARSSCTSRIVHFERRVASILLLLTWCSHVTAFALSLSLIPLHLSNLLLVMSALAISS